MREAKVGCFCAECSILRSDAFIVLGDGISRMVRGPRCGSHLLGTQVSFPFCPWPWRSRNVPAVPNVSNERSHFSRAFLCRLQNKSGYTSKAFSGIDALGTWSTRDKCGGVGSGCHLLLLTLRGIAVESGGRSVASGGSGGTLT